MVQETASNGAGFAIRRAVFAFQRNEKETATLIDHDGERDKEVANRELKGDIRLFSSFLS